MMYSIEKYIKLQEKAEDERKIYAGVFYHTHNSNSWSDSDLRIIGLLKEMVYCPAILLYIKDTNDFEALNLDNEKIPVMSY